MENLKRSLGESSLARLERSFWFPVEARSRFAFRSRITGADVSFIKKIERMRNVPAYMALNKKNVVFELDWTYNNGDKPEIPPPAFSLGKEATDDGPYARSEGYSHG